MISQKDRIGGESMLEVAERYLGELVQRCMVQVEVQEMPSVTRFKSCRLHDLMLDICLLKAEEENFFLFANHQNGYQDEIINSSALTRKSHRLVSHLCAMDVPRYAPPRRGVTRNLRSLTFSVLNKYEGHMSKKVKSQFSKFKMLRVLAIEGLSPGYTNSIKDNFHVTLDHLKLPSAIGKLIHLRYLSLRGSSFWWLTSSLGNLQHLQTLDLRATDVFRIPNVLWKMNQLRYLSFPDNNFSNPLGKLRLDSSSKLEILENFRTKFCHAKDLQLARLPNLEKWRIDEGALPNLSRLLISSCLKLEKIPDGLRFITTLKELEIQRMPTDFSDRVRVVDSREGEDFSKICHVNSIVIC